MTNECSIPVRIGTSFFYKMLVSIKYLQHCSKGATMEDIASFMEQTFCLSGDIRSQLEHALCTAVESRLVTKGMKYYSLVCPAANVHLIPSPCLKAKLEELQQIFNMSECPKKKPGIVCDCGERTTRSQSRTTRSQTRRSRVRKACQTKRRKRKRKSTRSNICKCPDSVCNCSEDVDTPEPSIDETMDCSGGCFMKKFDISDSDSSDSDSNNNM